MPLVPKLRLLFFGLLVLLLAGCGDSGFPPLDALFPKIDAKKSFYPDPLHPTGEPEPMFDLKLTNNRTVPVTYTIGGTDPKEPVFGEPPSGVIGPGETVCVHLFSRHPKWGKHEITVKAMLGETVVDEESVTVRNGRGDSLSALEAMLLIMSPLATLDGAWNGAAPCDLTFHSDGGMTSIPPPNLDLVTEGTGTETVDEEPTNSKFGVLQAPSFAPVQDGFVVAQDGGFPFVPGVHATVFLGFEGEIDFADPVGHYQYACVFDDGDAGNSYVPSPAFPNDYFGGSDLWYELLYNPTDGWTLQVTDARNNTFLPVISGARALGMPHGILFMIPLGELPPNRSYRVTAFRHEGDFGLNAPFVWSANTAPPMSEPMAPFNNTQIDPPSLEIETGPAR